MTLTEIKGAVAAYLHKTAADLTVDGFDLGLIAMNQVRMQAELNNNFGFNRKLVTVTVNGVTGGSLDTAVEYGTIAPVFDVKSIVDVGTLDNLGNFIPADWTTTEASLNIQRQDNRIIARVPTDAQALMGPYGNQRFVFDGDKVRLFPVGEASLNIPLLLLAYVFTPDWTVINGTSNVWTTKGAQYLQWQSVIHVNHLWKDFVFRQEGNLSPPKELADIGLANLIQWDAFKYEQFRRHSR
jgi:hypothetical protein